MPKTMKRGNREIEYTKSSAGEIRKRLEALITAAVDYSLCAHALDMDIHIEMYREWLREL